jgi:hypothetical protein
MDTNGKAIEILQAMDKVLDLLHKAKGEERSEYARRMAVTITEMEKVEAYYKMYAISASMRKSEA